MVRKGMAMSPALGARQYGGGVNLAGLGVLCQGHDKFSEVEYA